MNWVAPHLATRRVLGGGCTKWKVFHRVEQESINKEKKVVIKRKKDSPYWEGEEKGTGKGFIMQVPLLQLGMGS